MTTVIFSSIFRHIITPRRCKISTNIDTNDLLGRFWVSKAGKSYLGTGRIELLNRIEQTGSITKAAKEMGMSYKAAWDAVDAMNNLSESPLVQRETGGKGGGGTKLTEYGKRVVVSFRHIEAKHAQMLETLKAEFDDFDDIYNFMRRLSVKISVRNQMVGKITAVKEGTLNCEVDIEIAGGDTIAAVITKESVERLGLKVGMEAFALIKASGVMVAPELTKISARNQLKGTVEEINEGCLNAELKIKLSGGAVVTAQITKAACQGLGLKVGDTAFAVIKASSIMVGVE